MELGDNPRGGLLRASVPVAIGEIHIAPLAATFAAEYPEIQLDIVLSDLEVNLADGAFDLAVQLSPLRDSSLVAKRLATDRAIGRLVARRAISNGAGRPPESPNDLLSHDCLPPFEPPDGARRMDVLLRPTERSASRWSRARCSTIRAPFEQRPWQDSGSRTCRGSPCPTRFGLAS